MKTSPTMMVPLAIVAACGPTTAPDVELVQPFRSGERLTALVHDAGEGDRQFARWHDRQLGLDCEVMPSADGTLRCVPGVPDVAAAFSDADCSEPAYRPTACGEIPPAVRRPLSSCSNEAAHASFRVGESVGERQVFYQVDGRCVSAPESPELYALDLIEPSSMAGFDARHEARGADLELVIYRGEDGSHVWAGTRDVQDDHRCDLWGWWTDEPTCVPIERAIVSPGYYTGSDCASGSVAVRPLECEAPRVIVQRDDAELLDVGATLEPTAVFYENALTGECELLPSASEALFEAGPPIHPATFPSLEVENRGTGRLRPVQVRHPEGLAVAPTSLWWDEGLGLHCKIRETRHGLRCLPTDPLGDLSFAPTLRWADSNCRDSMLAAAHALVPGFSGRVQVADPHDACAGVQYVVRLGNRHEGPVYHVQGGECVEVESDFPAPGGWYSVDLRVSVEQLPPVDLVEDE